MPPSPDFYEAYGEPTPYLGPVKVNDNPLAFVNPGQLMYWIDERSGTCRIVDATGSEFIAKLAPNGRFELVKRV